MNLYLCYCISQRLEKTERLPVYVVASDPQSARILALNRMRELNWRYDDRVDRIDLVASAMPRAAEYLLVIEPEED